MEIVSSGIVAVPSGVSSTGLYFIQEGILQVLNDGWAQDIGLAEGGRAVVSSGGILYVCTVSSGGTAAVLKGGCAQDITVETGGLYLVSSGGTTHRSLIQSGGTQIVYADVMAAAATVMDGGVLDASSGAYVRAPIVSKGGILQARNGALVDGAQISGLVEVNSKAAVNSAAVLDGGKLAVLTGGYAYEAKISSGGSLDISSGGRANYAAVYEGGAVMVSAGASCLNAGISGGSVTLAGAVVPGEDDPEGEIIPGGFASNTTVNSGGSLIVSSGATATKIQENGGYVSVAADADVTFTPNTFSGLVLSSAAATVHAGTTATDTTLNFGGWLYVFSGGIASATVDNSSGGFIISSGGTADVVTVNFGGGFAVSNGGTALRIKENGGLVYVFDDGIATFEPNAFSGVVLDSDNWATVHSGTTATGTVISSGAYFYVSSGGIAKATVAGYGGGFVVSSGGTADVVTVDFGGGLAVYSGGTALGIKENGGLVYVEDEDDVIATFKPNAFSGAVLDRDNWATVHSGTTATDTAILFDSYLYVFSGGTANVVSINLSGTVEVSGGLVNGAAVNSGGSLLVFNGGKLTGTQTFEAGAVVSMYDGSILNFDLTQTEAGSEALVNDLSVIQGVPVYTLTVSGTQEEGVYTLAEGATGFSGAITVQNTLGETFGTLTVGGETVFVGGTGYTLNLTDSSLTVAVETPAPPVPENLVGSKERVSWDPTGAEGYVVEYSTDGFAHALQVDTTGNAVDMLDLPAGTYRWRVKINDGEAWAVGDEIVSDNDNTPKVLQSNADGSDDLFFAQAGGTWENFFYAQHAGSVNDWSGTNELILVNGKNKLADLFFGSNDANILSLTDDENGDGIFVDDEYTELPDGIIEQQSRIARIDEIRAGAGDDIVDMTSYRIEYIGDGLIIRGGDGNDVIWANKGDNLLFGDAGDDRIVGASGCDVIAGGAGNDRMHGGGGVDVFTFCENFGEDIVEQLADGSVLLWFASGSEDNWSAETMTYKDGENSVTVKGVSADHVLLEFGDDGSDRFNELVSAGGFLAFTSQRIFEESGKGILASP